MIHQKPGGITVPLSAAYAYHEAKGWDPVKLAIGYVQAWAAKVPVGTETIFAKLKCELSDELCGCAKDSTNIKCKGPYPPVNIEILMDVLEKGIDGVEMLWYPAPQATVVDGHVHQVEKIGPGLVVYVKKV